MNLEDLLKKIKLNESAISTMLGIAVVVVIGVLIINYFRGLDTGNTLTPAGNTQSTLPTTHIVAEGETLWDIAENYYDSGYNWVSIADANNLVNANSIDTGQQITIPDVEPILLSDNTKSPEETPQITEADNQPDEKGTTIAEALAHEEGETSDNAQENYTVKAGDSLWSIAEQVYNDGFQWTKIAEANNLANPSVIHTGNVFSIPR